METVKKRTRRWPAAVAVAALLLALLLFGRWYEEGRASSSSTDFLMNTFVSQTVYGPHREEAIAAVVERLRQFESVYSLYKDGSQIEAINQNAGIAPVEVDAEVFTLIARAKALSEESGGAFDITVAPLSLLWDITGKNPRVPAQGEIDQALALVDYRDILLDEERGTVMLRRPGQKLDLGAIAKGYACAVAGQVYQQQGVESAVLSIGGNVYTVGHQPGGKPFDIGVSAPVKDRTELLGTLHADGMVISTSGAYERYFEVDGQRYHHIFDPATGWPAQSDLLSVTVISEDGALADAMSTALFVEGLSGVKENLDREEFSLLAVDATGAVYLSDNIRDDFVLTDENYHLADA